MKSFAGKTALISGASSGIGLGLAEALAARGVQRIAITGTSPEKLKAAAAQLDASGAEIMTLTFDVTDEAAWHDAAQQVQSRWGALHVLMLNAGIGTAGLSIETTPTSMWRQVFDVNVMGVVHGLQACLPGMKAHGEEGYVLLTSSIAAVRRMPTGGPYCSAKAAVLAIGEILRSECMNTALGVSVLLPAAVRTPLAKTSERHVTFTIDPQITAMMDGMLQSGLDPLDVANFTLDRMLDGSFYIFSHPDGRSEVAARQEELRVAMLTNVEAEAQ